MAAILIESFVIVFLILINGLFAMSEIALVSSRKARLQQLADSGNRRAAVALDLMATPDRFLSTVQIGITLVGILAGVFGGATIAGQLAGLLNDIPAVSPYGEAVSVVLVVLCITYASLVVGELAPKRIALNNAEVIALRVAPLMRLAATITSPAVRLLTQSTRLVLRIVHARPPADEAVSEEEINLMLKHGAQLGAFHQKEREMVERVFRLGDLNVNALMTPRTAVVWLNADEPSDSIRNKIISTGYTCYPVAHESLDDASGIVFAKDLFSQSLSGIALDVRRVLRPAPSLPQKLPALEALQRFQESSSYAALVVDEFGGVQGLVTINDILRSIVRGIHLPGEPARPRGVLQGDGSWMLDGRLPIADAKDLLRLQVLPGEEAREYQTVAGFVMTVLGRLPEAGDRFDFGGYDFEVTHVTHQRVDKILARKARREDPGHLNPHSL